MDHFPVAIRELLLASRRAAVYWSRSFSGMVAVLVCAAMMFAGFGGLLSPQAAGRGLFGLFCFIGWLLVLCGGVIATADSLGREHREGTLGLLFLTDLSSYDIVGGKLAAQGCTVLYCLLAALPMPGLAFFIGGVDFIEYAGAALACVNTLFFASTLGLLMSSVCHNAWRSLIGAFSVVAIHCVVVPGIGWIVMTALNDPSIHWMFLWGPTGSFLAVFCQSAISDRISVYITSLLLTHLSGWLCFFFAGQILHRHWREKGGMAYEVRMPESKADKPVPKQSLAGRFMLDDRWWEVNPVFRMGVLVSKDNRIVKGMLGGACLCWLACLVFFSNKWIRPEVVFVTGFLVHCFVKVAMAVDSSKAFSEDRRSGLLELIMTTPIRSEDIVKGKILALKRQYLLPAVLVLIFDAILFVSALPRLNRGEIWLLLVGGGGGFIFLAADLYVMAWAGLWFGLKTDNTWKAVRHTVMSVLVMPWCIWLICMALLGGISNGSFGSDASLLGIAVAIVMFATNCLGMVGWASSHLNDDFRIAVART